MQLADFEQTGHRSAPRPVTRDDLLRDGFAAAAAGA